GLGDFSGSSAWVIADETADYSDRRLVLGSLDKASSSMAKTLASFAVFGCLSVLFAGARIAVAQQDETVPAFSDDAAQNSDEAPGPELSSDASNVEEPAPKSTARSGQSNSRPQYQNSAAGQGNNYRMAARQPNYYQGQSGYQAANRATPPAPNANGTKLQ